MKKTLVALALAATTVSGSAMAWTAGGAGGSLELGGTLTPENLPNPWEVLIGSAVTGLDADIKIGSKIVEIPVTSPVTVLGIRTVSNQPFRGMSGITPQIDFKGAIDVTKYTEASKGTTPLTVKITDAGGMNIGVLNTVLSVAGLASYIGTNVNGGTISKQVSLYHYSVNGAFRGGVLIAEGIVNDTRDVKTLLNSINTDFLANYNSQGLREGFVGNFDFQNSALNYSGVYGSGIEAGKTIRLTLDAPAASDAIVWKAALPITVSYQ
ncbi:hypothetical protein LA211_003794 [Salmonella enterica]|nr:hypothetical protein [Salmonella enterica]